MIQRIQSVYLLLAAVALALIVFFPISVHTFRGLTVDLVLLDRSAPDVISASMMINLWPALSGVILLVLLAFVIIFLFRNRPLQMRLTMIAVLLNMILVMGLFWMSGHLAAKLDPESIDHVVNYQFGIYLPIISLLFFILAYRGIRKDERMVRAADRLR